MTRKDAPPSPPAPPSEGEYARKLALAILSTLQTKGLLSSSDVDAILIAARRSAQGQPAPTVPHSAPVPMQVTVQPSQPGSVQWHTEKPAAPPEAPATQQTAEAAPAKPEPKTPPVIDLKLD